MVNLKINLMPWRQKRRDRLQKEFVNALAAVGLMAVFLLVSAWQVYVFEIDAQESRVAFIGSEIQGLDARIAEIRVLQKKRKELRDRMRVIQELQGNRPVSVRLPKITSGFQISFDRSIVPYGLAVAMLPASTPFLRRVLRPVGLRSLL